MLFRSDGGANLDVAKPWDLEDTKAQEAKDDKDKAKTDQTETPNQTTQPDPNAQVDQNSEDDSNNPQISTQNTETMDGSTEPDSNAQPTPGTDQNVQPVSEPDPNIHQTYVGDTSMNPDAIKKLKESKVVRKVKNSAIGKEAGRRLKLAGGGKAVATNLAKKLGKGAVRTAFTVGTGAAAAAAGIGLGMVGGDISDVFKYGAAGLSAGAYFGNRVAGQAAVDTLTGKNSLGSFVSNVAHGGYEENQRRKARKNYINDRDNLERIAAKHKDFDAEKVKDWAAREFDIQYATGIDNAKYADKALQMEDKYVKAYKDADYTDEEAKLYAAQIAQGALARTDDWSKSELNDRKKRDGYVADLAEQYKDKGVKEENARMYAENEIDLTRMIYGQKGMDNIKVPKKEKTK